ncbi:hypothetical protein [Opitutus sp. ER46]|uniref:hypothetical protein n=1 Tax=Opitutus sp. ER46 TaxID=2161864 RepID=UPI000D30E26F|nr:hypothetical protein [Opitutus sp. ER46]PTX95736.1 hypothetical protein DB354_10015 [Opitutus sp. ER46]
MTENEHLLEIVAEECVEVAQRISKALRFGTSEIQPNQPYTNAERVMHEYADLIAIVEMCQGRSLLPDVERWRIEEKKAKIDRFLQYARQCGTVTEAVQATNAANRAPLDQGCSQGISLTAAQTAERPSGV